jgi:kumamolisin
MDKAAKGISLAGSARMRPAESKWVSTVPDAELLPITLLLRYPPGAPPMPSHDDWTKMAPHQRKFLSVAQYVDTYGATKEDMAAVLAFAAKNNMTLFRAEAATRSVALNCPAASAKSAFGVQLSRYESPDPMVKGEATHTHYGFEGEVHLPPDMADIITAVIGLDDRNIHAKPAVDFTGDPPPASSAVPLLVSECAQLYRFPALPASTPATDVVIGIHAPGGSYLQTDINTYFTNTPTGWQTVPVMQDANCVVGGTTYKNGVNPVDPEVSLDIQTSTTIAQGCTANVYFTQNSEQGWVVFMNRVLVPPPGEKQPQVLTTSYPLDRGETLVGDPKNPSSQSGVMTALFQALAMQGINVFASAGDYGSEDRQTDSKAHVQYPAR